MIKIKIIPYLYNSSTIVYSDFYGLNIPVLFKTN